MKLYLGDLEVLKKKEQVKQTLQLSDSMNKITNNPWRGT